jgi:hypothetical protein
VSSGELSSRLAENSAVPVDLEIPAQLDFGAGVDVAIAPRMTLVADVFGRSMRRAQRFTTGNTIFSTGAPGVQTDVAAATDLISTGPGNFTQALASVGGRINLGGSVFANGAVKFPVLTDGLKPKTSAVFSIDFGF